MKIKALESKILKFLLLNPGVRDTDAIARALGKEESDIKKAMSNLVRQEIVGQRFHTDPRAAGFYDEAEVNIMYESLPGTSGSGSLAYQLWKAVVADKAFHDDLLIQEVLQVSGSSSVDCRFKVLAVSSRITEALEAFLLKHEAVRRVAIHRLSLIRMD